MKDDGTGSPPPASASTPAASSSNPAVPGATLPCGKTTDPLLAELAAKGIKHSPADIVAIGKKSDGTIVFLEKGNTKAGLQHILDAHKDDFARIGVKEDDIPAVVMEAALKDTPPVSMQGKKPGRPVHEVMVNGQPTRIAVTTGNNGFIVGANPAGSASPPTAAPPAAAPASSASPAPAATSPAATTNVKPPSGST